MAPLTIYPNRRHLIWSLILFAPLTLFFLGGAAWVGFGLAVTASSGIPDSRELFLLGASLVLGALFFLKALTQWLRLRRSSAAMSIEDRGLRLLERPPMTFAKRPVFLPWSDIASLTFERGQQASSLSIRTHDGKAHRMIVAALSVPAEDVAEECLARAHQAGLIGTSEKRRYWIADRTEWRLAAA